MSIYVNLHRKIWNDEKFPFTSDDCQLVFFHLISTPLGTQFGLFKAGIAGLAEEKRWGLERYRKAFDEAVQNRFIEYDERALLVRITKFLRYNKPNNPNVLKSWAKQFHELPESNLKLRCFQDLKALCKGLSEPFQQVFREAFEKPLANALAKQAVQYSDSDTDSDTGENTRARDSNSISISNESKIFLNDVDLKSVKESSFDEKKPENTIRSVDELENSGMSIRAKNFIKKTIEYWPEYSLIQAIDTLGAILPYTREWDDARTLEVLMEARGRWPSDRKVYWGTLNKLHPYLVSTFQNETKEKRKPENTTTSGVTKRDVETALTRLSKRIGFDESIEPVEFRKLINEAKSDEIILPEAVKQFIRKLRLNGMITMTKDETKIEHLNWDNPHRPSELYKGQLGPATHDEVKKMISEIAKKKSIIKNEGK